jgi:hypothetical protein
MRNYLLASFYLVIFEIIMYLYMCFQNMDIKITTACKNTNCTFAKCLYPVTIHRSHCVGLSLVSEPFVILQEICWFSIRQALCLFYEYFGMSQISPINRPWRPIGL